MMRIAAAVALVDAVVAVPVGLILGRAAGRWATLPGMYAISVLLVAAGVGAWARLVVDGGVGTAGVWRMLASAGLFVLGLFWVVAGCGGLVALTAFAVRGRS